MYVDRPTGSVVGGPRLGSAVLVTTPWSSSLVVMTPLVLTPSGSRQQV